MTGKKKATKSPLYLRKGRRSRGEDEAEYGQGSLTRAAPGSPAVCSASSCSALLSGGITQEFFHREVLLTQWGLAETRIGEHGFVCLLLRVVMIKLG